MGTRTYPRKSDEYPEIMSKLDPLIIRVSETVLLVGSTSYTAKIKIGVMFSGFHVYVSSVGLPIFKQAVNIDEYNATSDKNIENTDAYQHIKEEACTWLDKFEESMLSAQGEKNLVDLLREIKFQLHYDLSGHVPNKEVYGDSLEVCETSPTYIQEILSELKLLNKRISALDAHIYGGTDFTTDEKGVSVPQEESLCGRITAIETSIGIGKSDKSLQSQLSNIRDSLGTNGDNGIWKDIKQIHSVIGDSDKGTVISKLNDMKESLNSIGTNVHDVNTSLNSGPENSNFAVAISSAVEKGLASMVAQMSIMNTNIETVDSVVDNILESVGDISGKTFEALEGKRSLQDYLRYSLSVSSGNATGVGVMVDIIKTAVNDIKSAQVTKYDFDNAIASVNNNVSNSSSSGAVGDLSETVNSIYLWVWDIFYNFCHDDNEISVCNTVDWLREALDHDDETGRYIKTEISAHDLIEDDRIKAIV